MSFNNTVIELLKDAESGLSVHQIAGKTALSINYVRTQLRHMEQAGIIERVDERLPIIYRVNKNHDSVRNADAVAKAKKDLLLAVADGDNDMGKFVKQFPKKFWPDAAKAMEVYSIAIKELANEGKLVDTL